MIVGMLGSPSISSATLASILRDFLTILKGFRNGLVYGAKIRLPHALVMTLLFRPESYV
jgi:peroxisomal membrane protein 4